MKQILLASIILAFAGFPGAASAQQTKPQNQEKVYAIAEQMPVFPGGDPALESYFKTALAAHKFGYNGRVILSMVIDKTGQPKDIEVGKGLAPDTDAKVLEAARKMPKWQPGKQNNQPVNVRMTIPVVISMTAKAAENEPEDNRNYTFVEQAPQFPGGEAAMLEFINTYMKYPADARANNIQGLVIVQFVVMKNGELKDPKVLKNLTPDSGAEALRLVNSMPKWVAGKQNGRAVNVVYTLPIRFKIEEPSDKK